MKPCIYIRVSTEEQARAGLSLAEQERRCAAHATALGYDDVPVFSDPGVSGKSMNRPGIRDLQEYEPDTVIVWKVDRISRRLRDFLDFIDTYRVVSVTEAFDTSTPSGTFFLKMMGLFAEHERDTIAERTAMGQERARREGRPPGKAPYGYRRSADGAIERDPDTYPILHRIFKLRNQGLSGYTIAREVGIPSGTVYNVLRRKSHGKRTNTKASGQTSKPPKYMLTGIIICPECGCRMGVGGHGKRLICFRGCFNISYKKAWGHITQLVEHLMEGLRWYKPTGQEDDTEYKLLIDLADLEGQIARLTEGYKDGLIEKSEFAYHREPVDKEIKKVQAKIEDARRRMQEKLSLTNSLKYIDIFWRYVEAGDVVMVNKILRIIFPNGVTPFFKKTPAHKTGVSECSLNSCLREILQYLGEAIQG